MISIIAAVAENNVIGVKNRLPWRLSGDLKRFKELTMGKPVIMGKNTFKSIGRALPGRKNIVLTDEELDNQDITQVGSVEEAIKMAGDAEEVMVIGGAMIYKQFLSFADRLYITQVHVSLDCDAFFPEFSEKEWKVLSKEAHTKDESNEYDYDYIVYEKK